MTLDQSRPIEPDPPFSKQMPKYGGGGGPETFAHAALGLNRSLYPMFILCPNCGL